MNPESSLNIQKTVMREKSRALRRNLGDEERHTRDSAIQEALFALITHHRPQTVAAYCPFDGEPDLLPVLKSLQAMEINVAMPLINTNGKEPSLVFRYWDQSTLMQSNRFGNPEPAGTAEILLCDIDMVLLPLVAWDEYGGRLGMGAGFYDRALEPFRHAIKPLRVGVAYELQKVPRVLMQPWDIYLHKILSESGLRSPNI